MSNPLVSVTVCVRDGLEWVDGCMESLLQQTWRPLEIIAVDDGSTDGSTDRLRSYEDPDGEIPVRVLTQAPAGLAAGRAAACEAANGTWVAITDIDVRPTTGWIEALMASRDGLEDENVVAVTGRTVFEEGDDLVSRLRSIEIERKYRSRPRRTILANGPCSIFRADALQAVGGFNPAWYHAEDMEVSLNLIAADGSIVYTPDAVVRHVPEIGRKRFAQKRRRDARAHVRIMRRWPRSARKGMAFDFLGTPILVLSMLPLRLGAWGAFLGAIGLGVLHQAEVGWNTSPGQTQAMLGVCMMAWLGLMAMAEAVMWFSPLGATNREALEPARRKRPLGWWASKASFGLRALVLAWSVALWSGLLLGALDAVLGRNGHRQNT